MPRGIYPNPNLTPAHRIDGVIDGQGLGLLLSLLGLIFINEAPFVANLYLREIGIYQILPLWCVIGNLTKINVWRHDLPVGEADLTLELRNITIWMTG